MLPLGRILDPLARTDGWPRDQFVKIAVERLKRAKDEVLDSFTDLTTIDLGRAIRLFEEVSHKLGVHIVAATGYWVKPPRCMGCDRWGTMTEYLVREIQLGIDGTDIRASAIPPTRPIWAICWVSPGEATTWG